MECIYGKLFLHLWKDIFFDINNFSLYYLGLSIYNLNFLLNLSLSELSENIISVRERIPVENLFNSSFEDTRIRKESAF